MDTAAKLTIRKALLENQVIGKFLKSRLAMDNQRGVELLADLTKLSETFIENNISLIKNWI